MVQVDILTAPGCQKCEHTKRVLKELVAKQQAAFPGLRYRIVDLTQQPEVARRYNVMATPGVVIDGKLEFQGVVPSEKHLVAKIRERARGA